MNTKLFATAALIAAAISAPSTVRSAERSVLVTFGRFARRNRIVTTSMAWSFLMPLSFGDVQRNSDGPQRTSQFVHEVRNRLDQQA